MARLGRIGGPVQFASGIAVLLGIYEQVSGWSAIATLLVFVWEGSLGIYHPGPGLTMGPDRSGATGSREEPS